MKTSINLTMDSRKEVPSRNLVDKSLAFLLMHKKLSMKPKILLILEIRVDSKLSHDYWV